MQRFVVSTIGTSILTNLIDRGNPAEGTWFGTLRDSAHLKQDELTDEAQLVLNTLAVRALEELNENNAATNRWISAELNGIHGIYGDQLQLLPDNQDQHHLICTDTAQGQMTGDLIKDFLESQGFTVGLVTPSQLSTQDPESFTTSTKELIKWLEDNVPRRGSGYHVIFNLVGGFKSLQGYMNTFGASYADEVVYIFESPTADLIKIPRLPIQIDTTVIKDHLIEFALMAAGKIYLTKEIEEIPETLLEYIEENGRTFAGLSAWGGLIWQRTKSDLLSGELLQFPRLGYRRSFIDDYRDLTSQQRTDLQETLAKITTTLEDTGGDTTQINQRVSGLNFRQLTNFADIYTFRIARGIRVSCSRSDDGLSLHRYGPRNTINQNPN